jgi:hypothetical protein
MGYKMRLWKGKKYFYILFCSPFCETCQQYSYKSDKHEKLFCWYGIILLSAGPSP